MEITEKDSVRYHLSKLGLEFRYENLFFLWFLLSLFCFCLYDIFFSQMKLLNQFYICTPTHKKVILYHASSMTISIHRYSYASMYVCFFRFIYLFLHLFSHSFFVTLFYKKIAHHSTPHHTTPHHTPQHVPTIHRCSTYWKKRSSKSKI